MMSHPFGRMNRRDFFKTSAASVAGLAVLSGAERAFGTARGATPGKTKVALVKTNDRKRGVTEALKLLDVPSPKGKPVLLKPNFNTSDPTPGSTHNDTLRQLVLELRERGAAAVTLGESSGPPPTKKVMEEKGVLALADELKFGILNFEELAEADWVHFDPPGNHWAGGFDIPKAVATSEYLVSTCCLKTHQYGGVFTMSLKLAVGLTPKSIRRQLHRSPDMRRMIAELNLAYKPQFIVLDGVEAFVDGGPSQGKKVSADVFVAGTDRVAVDAVGVAILKDLGSNEAIMGTKIFAQEQIQRAVELGLGISRPDEIELVAADDAGRAYAEKIKSILAQG